MLKPGRVVIVIAIVIMVVRSGLAEAPAGAVLQSARSLSEAIAKGEKSTMEKLLDPDFTATDSKGKTRARAEVIQDPSNAADAAGPEITAGTRMYGDVSLILTQRGPVNIGWVWVHRSSGWRLLVYQATRFASPGGPPGAGVSDCENPCKTVPYTPKNTVQQAIISSWQALETAVTNHDAAAWSRHVSDDFLLLGSMRDHPFTKQDRMDILTRQKAANTPSAPSPALSAQMFEFGSTVVMIAMHQPFHGNPVHVVRIWVQHQGAWQMAFSQQTAVENAQSVVPAPGPPLRTLHVIGISARPLPIVVAQSNGIFASHGLKVELELAVNSDIVRGNLAGDKADIAHAAVDNDVAMVESGAADTVIVMGGERSANELIAQPGIKTISDLRGHTTLVDAPQTAFALQLKKILLSAGLEAGRDYELKAIGSAPQRFAAMRENKNYAATMLGPPISLLAQQEGFVSLGSTRKFIGPYQSIGAFAKRDWAGKNADTLVQYIAAYIEAERWLASPANKQQVIELMMKESHLSEPAAGENYEAVFGANGSYEPDGEFDREGFKNVLKLRADVEGTWGGKPPAPEKYYDLSYYEKALAQVK